MKQRLKLRLADRRQQAVHPLHCAAKTRQLRQGTTHCPPHLRHQQPTNQLLNDQQTSSSPHLWAKKQMPRRHMGPSLHSWVR